MKECFCIYTPQTAPKPPVMRTEICLTRCLNCLSFSSIPSSVSQACVVRSPQTLEILSSFFPALFYIFIFILLYLITHIPLSISFIPSSSLFPSLHPRFQSSLSLSTSRIHPQEAPPLGRSVSFLSIHPSSLSSLMSFISKALPTKLLCENCFTDETYFHSFNLATRPLIHPRPLIVSHKIFPRLDACRCFPLCPHTHMHIQYVRTHTQTLKYRASSDPNRRKGDGGSEIS